MNPLKSIMTNLGLVIFFGVFFAVGIGMVSYGIFCAKRSLEVGRWPIVSGRIISAEMEGSPSSDGDTFIVKAKYEYEVDNEKFTGDRIAFGYFASSDYARHEAILNRLRAGAEVLIRYSDDEPSRSALSYGIHNSLKTLLAFGVTWLFFTTGLAYLFWLGSGSGDVLLDRLVVKGGPVQVESAN